jgi:hypothetical protein
MLTASGAMVSAWLQTEGMQYTAVFIDPGSGANSNSKSVSETYLIVIVQMQAVQHRTPGNHR